MSQPLSGVVGRKIAIEPDPERGPKLSNGNADVVTTQRVLAVREVVALILMIAAVVLIPVGAGMLWGLGGALLTLGVLVGGIGVLMAVV